MQKKFDFPHIYVILMALTLVACLLTHFVPAGEYARVQKDGREVVDPASFHAIPPNPATILDYFASIHKGLVDTANIIFFIFMTGGAFKVLEKTGAINAALHSLSGAVKGRGVVAIPFIMLAFGFTGAIMGLAEETLPFVPIMTALMASFGFPRISGAMVVLLGAGAGFSAALTNPFTIGIAQGLAGLPMFSGISFRITMFVAFEILTIGYVCLFVKRACFQSGKIGGSAVGASIENIVNNEGGGANEFSVRQKLCLLALVATLAVIIIGVVRAGWYMTEIAASFLAMSIVVSAIAGFGLNKWALTFGEGMTRITGGALIVGFAKSIPIVLTDGHILDTILHAMASLLNTLPVQLTSVGMYFVQCLLNFLLPSGGGQAAVSMPIMAPLSDMVGITRQTAVIAFQLGDGISNVYFPTSGYFMAALALGQIEYRDWVKSVTPLILMQYALGLVFVLAAGALHLGPF